MNRRKPSVDLPPPHVAFGLLEDGQRAECELVVAEVRTTAVIVQPSGTRREVTLVLHAWGDHGPTEMRLSVWSPSEAWTALTRAFALPDLPDRAPQDLLARRCRAVAEARPWLPDRPWVELVELAPVAS